MTSNNPPRKDKPVASILKETREKKGISLEMAHEATKIPLDALKSIEQGYSVHKLQQFYYRGFIKIYAKYLELDETFVLQEYGMQESAAPKPQPVQGTESKLPEPVDRSKKFIKETIKPLLSRSLISQRSKKFTRWGITIVLIFAFLKIAGCVISKNKPAKVSKQTVQKSDGRSPAAVQRSNQESTAINEAAVPKLATTVNSEKVNTVPAVKPKHKEAKVLNVEAAKPEPRTEKVVKAIELTVRATKSGWLQVKADGEIVFQSTLKKGDSETWRAEKSIELSGKNINLLEFELNGKMLGALGVSDRGAKKVMFTKDGLSVRK